MQRLLATAMRASDLSQLEAISHIEHIHLLGQPIRAQVTNRQYAHALDGLELALPD